MMHAGGKMFSVPYLVAQANNEVEASASEIAPKSHLAYVPDLKASAIILSKAFGIEASLPFTLHHPSVIPTLLRNRSVIKAKRKAATQLSKLTADFLKEGVGD